MNFLTLYNGQERTFIPLLSAAACGYLMYNLGSETWIGFLIWLAAGLVIYALYGYNNSKLNKKEL
ncbi:amino acid permease C-terminal domain-containing protein [Paenibacillus sp. BR2-3]|uniref:amino acid permease C-terminal domain-containing protein n=1 Tax=Paenibacillus sp. BR2-3 TaxID=3048494 RepID=UPI003977E451